MEGGEGAENVYMKDFMVQIHLPEGQHSLKLQITASGMNINWFVLSFLQGEAE
ncbi:hypothetical protein [Neobacillus cucumis]|uniref:hypothetical protein n=1 Tax=Neobacillus cucumis TaxID=1740721 RepID=UPI002E243022|nr:hypothetical protein [Neobacillus cucumis]